MKIYEVKFMDNEGRTTFTKEYKATSINRAIELFMENADINVPYVNFAGARLWIRYLSAPGTYINKRYDFDYTGAVTPNP